MSFSAIITSMAQGLYRIPRFQRTFVWERSRIQTLLDSMYREYPIGTIFLWKAPAEYNHMLRSVDYLNQPNIDPHQSYTFILDGQQRLTSLYVTVNGLKIRGEAYGKIVADLTNEEPDKYFHYRTPDNRRWVAISDLLRANPFELYNNLPSDQHRERFQAIRERLSNYPFSVVSVSSMNLEDAIEIFERINQQSKRLTRYDLIAASVLTDEFDLRERSQKDIIGPLKTSFGVLPETNVPQALALNIKGGTEYTTQMGLKSGEIQQVWNRTVECLKLAVDFVRANLGVKRADFMPYSAMLPMLGYYFFYGNTNQVKSSFHRDQLEKWFWRTAFSERYGGSSQTRMTEDAARIRRLLDTEQPFDFETMPVSLDGKTLSQVSMLSTTSAVRNGVLCMLNLKRPMHFINGAEIVIEGDHFSKFTLAEKHHIFPISFLQAHGIGNRYVHSLPNFCFIPSELNQNISNSVPSEYFGHIQEQHKTHLNTFERIMQTHMIPIHDDSGIWDNNFTKFLNERAKLMIAEIRVLCGITINIVPEQRNPLIDYVETSLRECIHQTLNAAYGLDYWRQAVPGDVKNRIEERIEAHIKNIPSSKRQQFDDLRVRLDLCDTSDYEKIIVSGQNWSHFSVQFRHKQDTERMLGDFRNFRNIVKHNKTLDTLAASRGQTAILWLAKALMLDLSEFGL